MANAEKPVTPEMIKKVEKLASRGLTAVEIAHCIGLSKTNLYKKKAINEELEDAINRGRSRGIKQVSNFLFKSAEKGNVAAQIFYLKCRGKWREEDEVQKSNELEKIKEEILKLSK